jgi:secreted Zn-dependent insulinase-like peptidase
MCLITIMDTVIRYPDGDDLMFQYDPTIIREFTLALTRDKFNIFLRSKEIPAVKLDQVLITNTEFNEHMASVPDRDLVWDSFLLSKQFTDQFHLPEPNMFIAEDTSLCAPDQSFTSKHPVKLLSDPLGELFYRPDQTFLQPRAYIQYLLRSPNQLEFLTNSCLLDLMVMCLLLRDRSGDEGVRPVRQAAQPHGGHHQESGRNQTLEKVRQVIISN